MLEGRDLLYSVADVIRHDDGSVGALVRGDVPQVVALQAKSPLRDSSCTCGATEPFTPCAHSIAVRLRYLQLFHGLDDTRTARWVRRMESLRALRSAWDGLAQVWLEATRHGDEGVTWTVLRDVESLDGAVQIARALEGRATAGELSGFLLCMATEHGIVGTAPLALSAVSCALGLAEQFWWWPADASPGARTGLLLAVSGSARRTPTTPEEDVRLESALTFTWRALGQLVRAGEADADAVAEALLEAGLGAPASTYPWSAS